MDPTPLQALLKRVRDQRLVLRFGLSGGQQSQEEKEYDLLLKQVELNLAGRVFPLRGLLGRSGGVLTHM